MLGQGDVTSKNVIHEEEEFKNDGGFAWKVVKKRRRCLFKVRDLKPGEIFGHDELL